MTIGRLLGVLRLWFSLLDARLASLLFVSEMLGDPTRDPRRKSHDRVLPDIHDHRTPGLTVPGHGRGVDVALVDHDDLHGHAVRWPLLLLLEPVIGLLRIPEE